jgi:hypothetical protein
MKRKLLHRRPGRLVVAAALAAALISAGADAQTGNPGGPLPPGGGNDGAFRRLFVPADAVDEWPANGQQYMPLERRQFEQLVERAHERQQLKNAAGAWVASATLTARLEANDVLSGDAALETVLADTAPRVLSLAPWNAMVGSVAWQSASADATPPLVGLWPQADGQPPTYGVLVSRSGALRAEWTASPAKRSPAAIEYDLRFPGAVSQQLALDLPADVTPSMSRSQRHERSAIPGSALVRWTFQLAAGGEHRLTLRRAGATAGDDSPQPLASVTEAYRLTLDGLDYEAEFHLLGAAGASDRELRLLVPDSLHVIEVLTERNPAAWRRDDEDPRAILAPLPIGSSSPTITVRAAAALTFDKPSQLPRIVADRVAWSEGASTLWVDPTLELKSIDARGADLVNLVGVGVDQASGEVYRLQAWSKDAETEILVAPRTPQLRGRGAIAIEFADRELLARATVTLRSFGGDAFEAVADVAADWTIDAVQTVPDSTATWHVSQDDGRRRLYVQLEHAPAQRSPTQLVISARKPLRRAGSAARLADLAFLQFTDAEISTDYLLVKDRRGGHLEPDVAAQSALVDVESLSVADRATVGDVAGGLLFALDAMPARAELRVTTRPARYDGEGWIVLAQTEAGFQHQAEIECRPASGSVTEVHVATSRPLPKDAHWEFVASAEELTVAAVAPLAAAAAAGSDALPPGAEYRIAWSRPRSEPFRLRVTWRSEPGPAAAVTSFSLPGADRWQSWVVLRGRPQEVRADGHGCPPAAGAPASLGAGDGLEVIGCFRLGDDPMTPAASTPTLSMVKATNNPERSSVVCWHCEASTLQFADGNQMHRVEYRLEAHGGQIVALEFPPGVTPIAARLDGEAAKLDHHRENPQQASLRLPAGRPMLTLTLDLQSSQSPPGLRATIAPPLPTTDFAILRGRWSVQAPPNFSAAGRQSGASASWLTRLFGPLAGNSGGGSQLGLSSAQAAPLANAADAALRSAPRGWMAVSQDFVGAPAPVQLRRADRLVGLWYVAWLIVAALTAWLWPRAPRWIIRIGTVAAILSLITPASWFEAPQAVWLGIFAGVGVRCLLSLPSAAPVAAALALVAMAATSPGRLYAADDAAAPGAVLFPIDADGRPTGEDVYVPAALMQELSPSSATARYGGARWVLTDAQYRFELASAGAPADIRCMRGELRFRITTFTPQARIVLPLAREDAQWLLQESQLDGAAAAFDVTAAGDGFTIAIAAPGKHELKLALVPRTTQIVDSQRLALRIPPLPGATVVVSHPAGVRGLDIESSSPLPSLSSATQTAVKLAGVDRFKASWQGSAGPNGAAGLKISQLSRLEIDPASARLAVLLRLESASSELQRLELALSPELRLAPLPEDSPLELQDNAPNIAGLVQLKFRSPPQLPLTLPLEFQVQRSVSTGRLTFPAVRVSGADLIRNHFLVVADQRLRIREESKSGLTPVAAAEIEAQWGVAAALPSLRYAVASPAPRWSLNVEPVSPRFTARESLEAVCDAQELRISYAANIADIEGETLVYRLEVPAELRIDRATVVEDSSGEATPVRWSRPRPDLACIFLGRPLSQPHTLRLQGRIGYLPGRLAAAPRIRCLPGGSAPLDVILRRTNDVLVHWEGEPPASDATIDDPPGARDATLLVGRFAIARDGAEAPKLRVTDNDASFSADAAITLHADSTESTATCTLRGDVHRGVVDNVTLIIDDSWIGPFTTDSGGVARVGATPGDAGRKTLTVQVPGAVAEGESFTLRVSGALAAKADQQIRFPAVHIENAEAQRMYLLLPTTPGQQSVAWTLRGLESEALPASLAQAMGLAPGQPAQRVMRERFVAQRRVFPDAMRTAAVRFAETRASVDGAGNGSAVAELIVQPGGASHWLVELPAGAELVYAAIDGRPVLRPEVSGQTWTPPPGHAYLPRLATIGYRWKASTGARSIHLTGPKIMIGADPLPVLQSLWQVDSSPAAPLSSSAAPLTQRQFAAAGRAGRLAAVIDASPLAQQLPEWEWRQWFLPWLRSLGDSPAPEDAPPAAAANEAAWLKLRERLAAASDFAMVSPGGPSQDQTRRPADPTAAIWRQGADDGGLELTARYAGGGAGRWLVALAIGAVWWASARREGLAASIQAAAVHRPWLLLAASGLFWLLALSPPWVGAAIIAFSALAMYKAHRVARAAAPESAAADHAVIDAM